MPKQEKTIVSYIYIKGSKSIDKALLKKAISHMAGKAKFELGEEEGAYSLTLESEIKGLGIIQNSLSTENERLGLSFKCLIVPFFNERFIHYLDFVDDNSAKYLFELGQAHPELYYENLDVLEDVDVETLNTIKTYIEAGNSPSSTALKLYIHRNTVTYRVNRFYRTTGLNLKSFPNAVFIYFLISSRLKMLGRK
ncbi:MAG: helix-turn-helix domain-containing protein [Bacilli bacterium]|jgi:hypothetical protein|nr:helix-turn-helix domain-containing protein [Bacilli bacterium]